MSKYSASAQLRFARAMINSDLETLSQSIEGADVNSTTYLSMQPLVYALINRDVDSCRLLIELGADLPNALVIAAEKGNIEIITIILDKDPSALNQKNSDGFTALHKAAALNKQETVVYLLEQNADCSITSRFGLTAWDLAKDEIKELIAKYAESRGQPYTMDSKKSFREKLAEASAYGYGCGGCI